MEESLKLAFKDFSDARKGEFTPDDMLAEAKKKSSPFHQYFAERGAFDPKVAMLEHGRNIARDLFAKFRFTIKSETHTHHVPEFVKNPKVESNKQGYIAIAKVKKDPDLAREVMVREFRCAASALSRARAVAVALNLSDEVEDLYKRVSDICDRMEQHESQ